jgi:hypothetical protein
MKQLFEHFKALVGYSPGIFRMPLEFFKILATIMLINIVMLLLVASTYLALRIFTILFGTN